MDTANLMVRFSEEDLDLFSKASGDRNPLHLSKDFAERTAYGQRVVFGALGCVACLGGVATGQARIKRIVADFQRPMFLDVDYRLELTESRETIVIRLMDGSIPVLSTTVKLSPEELPDSAAGREAFIPLRSARKLKWDDLAEGLSSEGAYRADPEAVQELYKRWAVKIDVLVVEALLWSSYFVGMEAPGENALFFRATFDFTGQEVSSSQLSFKTSIVGRNPSLAQIRSSFALRSEDRQVVSGQLTAFVRPAMPALRLQENVTNLAETFRGKVALVIGASRGLGAAIAMTLAAKGASVVAGARSELSWTSDLPPEVAGRVQPWLGDASDFSALTGLSAIVKERFRRVDFLICSAFPAIPSYRLEAGTAERIQNYLTRATDLVLRPLCEFLPVLNESGGCAVLISSVATEQPVRDWPHYVAAKSAAEALVRVAPMQYPLTSSLIVRPERLLTEMTNTPMGRRGAASPMALAQQISAGLQHPPAAGRCEILALQGISPEIEHEISSPAMLDMN